MVEFSPTIPGVQTDTIELDYYNGVTAVQATNPLTGDGRTPGLITISDPDPFNFGTVVNTNTVLKTFTLTNSGQIDVTNITGLALTAPYQYEGGGAFPGLNGTCTNLGTVCLLYTSDAADE